MLDLSIIILNFNTKRLVLDCLHSFKTVHSDYKYDVWLVDNASSDGTVEAVRKDYPDLKIIRSSKNLGFAAGNNLALRKTRLLSRYSLLLNSDTVLEESFVDKLIEAADNYDYSIASCRLVNSQRQLQPNCGQLPKPLPLFVWLSGLDDLLRKFVRLPSYQERSRRFYRGTKAVGWVSGSVMLIRNTILDKVGYLDEKIFMYCEDVDYCWRTQKQGLGVGWTDNCEIVHLGGASSKSSNEAQWLGEFKGLIYLYRKYYGNFSAQILRWLIRFFILLRMLAFLVLGRKEVVKTYARVIGKI